MHTHSPPRFTPELLQRARHVRAAIFDVDGVLTDGRIYLDNQGEVFKAFHVLDGHGLKLLAQVGIEPIVITGRDSPAVRQRMANLNIQHALYGVHDKLAGAASLLLKLGLSWADTAVMGDDWPDLPLLRRAVLACSPPNAHTEAQAVAHYVTSARGGYGAAREYCDLLLSATGHYHQLLEQHLTTLDGNHA
jgi:3-deoxy-D-manno-octulosonate 8-phosphate phosphatase (KDO 8-P phosphatase)